MSTNILHNKKNTFSPANRKKNHLYNFENNCICGVFYMEKFFIVKSSIIIVQRKRGCNNKTSFIYYSDRSKYFFNTNCKYYSKME